MNEREAFEAWAFENGLQSHTDQSLDYPLGNVLWKCWQARAAVEADRDQRVPDGWKLVPVEPTKHMIDASALDDQMNSGSIRAAWKDMVEAAPLLASTPAPAQQERKPMTDEEIRAAVISAGMMFTYPDLRIARAVERHHGIKE